MLGRQFQHSVAGSAHTATGGNDLLVLASRPSSVPRESLKELWSGSHEAGKACVPKHLALGAYPP